MPHLKDIRTSLEVGFPENGLPEVFLHYRGKETRAIGAVKDFPYEDAQFEVVLMDGSAVSRASVREAHRVLKPSGYLFFIVPEKTRYQDGYTMPDVYSIVREGFNIVELERPPWWSFGLRGHTLTITARKKAWRSYRGLESCAIAAHTLFAGNRK